MIKNVLKKIMKVTVVASVCACLLMPGAALAKNSSPKEWSFYSSYGGSGYATEVRGKQDTSSVYISCTELNTTAGAYNGYFSAVPHGSKTANGTYSNMVYTKNGISYSAAKHTISRNTTKKMPSYIYEAGGRYAKIHYSTSFGHTGFGGVWSPDSI